MKQNKKFIEEQIGKTVDALNRDRLYSLLGQEVEWEMMARNREQFGFRIIDVPPDLLLRGVDPRFSGDPPNDHPFPLPRKSFPN
jgi:hypothetical protein